MQRSRRIGRGFRNALIAVVGVLVLVVIGFLAWASTPMMGDRSAALEAWRNPAVSIHDAGDSVVMAPTGHESGMGLVFVPGALVDPYAYLNKLSGAVEEAGLTVVITKPTLNLAFFDQRPLTTFTSHAPDVTDWYVGGHSLGGVRACQLAEQPQVKGLILFGSYCANDLSGSHLLPPNAQLVEIPGMNHGQFGNYGPQSGDNPATIDDAAARAALTKALAAFLQAHSH